MYNSTCKSSYHTCIYLHVHMNDTQILDYITVHVSAHIIYTYMYITTYI